MGEKFSDIFSDVDLNPKPFSSGSKPPDHNNSSGEQRKKDQTKEAETEFEDKYKPVDPHWLLDQVVLTESTRRQIDGALARILHRKTLFEDWGLSKIDPKGARAVLNFYGPPGTGKSMSAEAVAKHMNKMLIKVNYADLESKYVGDTPKNIMAAFESAKKHDAVIFFDEADSILGKRLTSVTQGADHGVNVSRSVMLLAMDQFEGIVVFATNLAQNFDSAFVRRIQTHVHFDLPDYDCRVRLAEYMLVKEMPITDNLTPASFAEISEGLSGGDFRTVVLNAAAVAVSRQGDAQRVSLDDIQGEIESVNKAKNVVAGQQVPKKVTEEETTIKDMQEELEDRKQYLVPTES